MSKKIENTPQKIYLQIGDEEINDFNELSDISWCADKIYDTDIEYSLSNQHSFVSDEEIERIILDVLNWNYRNPDYDNKLVAKEIFESISKWLQSKGDGKAIQCLKNIANPIEYFRKEAENTGGELNGQMAVIFSNDANFLKQIAQNFLDNYPPITK